MSSVKSSYTPGFFPLINRTNFLSRSSRCVLPFSRRVTTDALLQQLFPECPWVYTQGDWTFWTQDMIWLAYVFYGWHLDFKRHFKTVLSSQRCFAGGCGLYFSDSFSFDVVVLVLCFVKVKKRGVCCNTPIQPKTGSCMKARPKGYLSRESQKSWRKTPRLCMEDMECLLM